MSPTIVYYYSYICGGLADFLKFFFHLLDVCESLNLNWCVVINHPISKYIRWMDDISPRVLPEIPDGAYILGKHNFNMSFLEILKDQQYKEFVALCSLDFFSFNIKFPLSNELNLHNFQSHYIIEHFFTWNIPIQSYDHKIPYICIHVRTGDKHLSVKPSVDYCDQDERSPTNDELHKHIDNIVDMYQGTTTNIFFMSDNPKLRLNVSRNYKGIIKDAFCEDIDRCAIVNISYPVRDMEYYDKGLRMCIEEFEFLRRADAIYSISYSGFTILANYCRLNPNQELFKLYKI